jgi:hypothetical protein
VQGNVEEEEKHRQTEELGAHAEDNTQDESDIIKYVDSVSIDEIAIRIPWLEGSPELHAFKSHL